MPALLGVPPVYCAQRQHSFAKREVMRLPAHSCGQSSRPPPIGDARLQLGHVQHSLRGSGIETTPRRWRVSARVKRRINENSWDAATGFVYGAFTEDLQGWHSVGQSSRNPPIGDRRVQSGPPLSAGGTYSQRQHRST